MRIAEIEKEYESDSEFNYFFMSDLHIENPGHDRKLLKKELDYAVKHNADIFIGGDLFDMIISGDRKRFSPSHNKYGSMDAVINEAVDEAYTLLKPYAKNIKTILCGNHESTTIHYHGFDPVALLIYELNKLDGVSISYLGYQGYIRIKYKYAKGKNCFTYDIKASHGTGGSAEITKGTITLNRLMTAHSADAYWIGHVHSKVVLPDETMSYVNERGAIKHRSRKAFITGAYLYPVTSKQAKSGGRPESYNEDYGDRMRTLQSTGGIMMNHTILPSHGGVDVKLIC